ncbi:hypothetical protein [Verrucosispora sp. NA02020]|uniref:hypothetical protein n=1 Tax=Verrucosispora sp. NA02020 TaxID=2742132 RepID=UPI003D7050E3
MSNDPHVIPFASVVDALRCLGLDPIDTKALKRVLIEPGRIEVERKRLDADGKSVVIGNEVATETVIIKVGGARPITVQLASGGVVR